MIFGIVGPTGVGKSQMAIEIARTLDAEILSVDAYQVYQGMNIGTAKVSDTDLKKIPHHGINIISAEETFDVKSYQAYARKLIDMKQTENKPLICVGGSGFYLKSVLHHFEFSETILKEVPDLETMLDYIQKNDEEGLTKVHPNNHKRIKNLYLRLKSGQERPKDQQKPFYNYHLFGLYRSRENLKKIVIQRVDQMIEKGLEKEVRDLLFKGLSKTAAEAIGYKEWGPYFKGHLSLEETIHLIKTNTFKYIKKQETYFKHQFNIEWFNLDDLTHEEVKMLILKKIKHLKSV
jgi:tRNA dimethylallyltransferase